MNPFASRDDEAVILLRATPCSHVQNKHRAFIITLVDVYVDLLVFTRIAGTS